MPAGEESKVAVTSSGIPDIMKIDPEDQEQMVREGTLVSSLMNQPQANANQLLTLLEEPFKKKRGRKPKKYYEQKAILEQQLAEQRAQKAEINDIENEEEVLFR